MPTGLPAGPIQMFEDPYDPPVSYSFAHPGFLYRRLIDHPDYWIPVRELTQEELEAAETAEARQRRLEKVRQEEHRKVRTAAQEAANARATAIYRLRDRQGCLLYVGISSTPAQRWTKHAIDKDWWAEVSDLSLEWFETRAEARAHEEAAIKAEKPRYNVQHNRPAA